MGLQYGTKSNGQTGINPPPRKQWFASPFRPFLASEKESTTILVSGLTMAHDYLLEGAFRGLGYRVKHLDCPDLESLRLGKEFGNRGQCNPTYFTVGNLIKYLVYLRDVEGKSKEEIINNYIFVTSGSCGPCRFGTYVTEYRKALRDAGFDGFRVLLFQQQMGLKQATGEEAGLKMNLPFFLALLNALIIGDILNAIGYRIRPYEVEPGATDAALEKCKKEIYQALAGRKGLLPALWRCRRELEKVKVDRTRVKPRVSVIGEFWAMTTEGDGNYKLQSFLEQEGAEVDVQSVTAWILYLIWEGRFDTKKRMYLREYDGGRYGLKGKNPMKKLALLWLANKVLVMMFQFYARIMGLKDYHLPDMDEIARAAQNYYDNLLRGGEGHMEVGKLILNVVKKKANMTISVKPFGCMPSSGVSDGVQSLITEKYPEAIFLPIETTGDGAVNVYSRIQMALFKAKQMAQKEFNEALREKGLTPGHLEEMKEKTPLLVHPLKTAKHRVACTAANVVYDLPGMARTYSSFRQQKEVKEV